MLPIQYKPIRITMKYNPISCEIYVVFVSPSHLGQSDYISQNPKNLKDLLINNEIICLSFPLVSVLFFYSKLTLLFDHYNSIQNAIRLITMSHLYLCGKPCSTWTHNEIVRNLTKSSAFINLTMMESRSVISKHDLEYECYQFFNQIKNSITSAVTMVIHISLCLIGTLGSSEFGPK